MTTCDADPKAKLMTQSSPFFNSTRHLLTHSNRHLHGTRLRICTWKRIVEHDQQTVSRKKNHRTLVFIDQDTKGRMIFLQNRDHLFRLGGFCKGSEPPQVAEYHCNLTPMAFQQLVVSGSDHQLCYLAGQKSPELSDP